jgi:glutamine phosphoribosylpyrophosphate amidotransferase
MCIIAYNPKGVKLNKDRMAIAYRNNPDGVGFMWRDGDRVQSCRGFYSFDETWDLIERFEGLPYSLHFRFRTRGGKTEAQCHPFQILSKEKHGFDMFMMHNGTFMSAKLRNDEVKSDTQLFAEKLSDQLSHWDDPSDVLRKLVIERIEKTIGSGNKLVFMTSLERDRIAHEDFGYWLDGVWYSNRYSFARAE